MLANGVTWFDDWFAVETVAPGVIAIGEPRFHQNNWNYLITGERRALLFDTGPGVRDISKVVRALTTLPVTAMPSHMHFDHTGGLAAFRNIAVADLPILRENEKDGWLQTTDDLFLGFKEGMAWKPVRVNHWIPPGGTIELGGRTLLLLPTPGHSPDSVSLLDRDSNLLFAADFVYPGPLYAQIPGADLKSYLETAESLLPLLREDTPVFCAHGGPDGDGLNRAPRLARADIADLAAALEKLRSTNEMPAAWPVNARMSLLLWEPAFATWQGQP